MEWTGSVVRKLMLEGTKSEHEAIVLVSPEGEFLLRRLEGNAFGGDPELDGLVGKRIRAKGDLAGGYTLIMDEYAVV
ncbi:MAG TPA: hypothetical protein VMU84_11890 [Thermoanaerobaculia bacterium]|nr:hypothetical protein [Thermoanaerobaculia bacterium]